MKQNAPADAGRSPAYRSFRDDAVNRQVRSRRKRPRTLKAFAALFALAAVLWTTFAFSLPAGDPRNGAPKAACVEAGQRIAPWFKAERDRVAHIGLPAARDFNLLLAWFNNAQAQCAAGKTDRAAANFRALEGMLPQPDEPDEPDERRPGFDEG